MASAGNLEPLKLPSVLDLQAAPELYARIKAGRDNPAGLQLDASAVEELSAACIQILIAAGQDGRVSILSPSPGFTAAFEDLSLEQPVPAATLPPPVLPAPASEPAPMAEAPVEMVSVPTDIEEIEAMPADQPPMQRILAIDDSKTMRDMLMLTLRGAGYDVLQGVDGQHGIEVLGDQVVDAVITDINMPRMDGYEVIRVLRKKPHLDATPILVLTTESEKEKRNIAREAGATGWMVKPFDPARLIETLRKVLPESGQAAAEPAE